MPSRSTQRNKNSTNLPLGIGQSFIGEWESRGGYSGLTVAVLTDVGGRLYVDQSPDGVNLDSVVSFEVDADTNEVHRLSLARQYYRVRLINNGSPQAFMRLQASLGEFNLLSSPLNSVAALDADAVITKSFDSQIAVVEGLFSGVSVVNKFGIALNLSSGSGLSSDVWGGGGPYTGFPSAAEPVAVLSSSVNDTAAGTGARTVRLTGLDANFNVIQEMVTLNGTTPVNTLQSFIRVHTAQTLSAGSGGVNAGAITFRQATTTTNVFLTMVAGKNQTNCSAYTVPAGFTAYLRQITASMNQGSSSGVATGFIWTRAFGSVFRSRRPFVISSEFRLQDDIYGGLVLTEKSDVVIRMDTISNNNTVIYAGYDLILVRNAVN